MPIASIFIKSIFVGDTESFRNVIENCYKPVLVLGGGKSRNDRDLKRFTNANKAGLWFFETAKKNLQQSKELKWDKNEKVWRIL